MRYAVLLLVCLSSQAGPWNPPMFSPRTHQDGSQTWQLRIMLSDIPEQDRHATDRDEKIAGIFLAHHKFCTTGWTITTSTIEKGKWLVLDGKCTTH